MSRPLIGCIADDFTGATDLANQFVRAGLRVVQTIGVPQRGLDRAVDVVVVALKSRTIPAEEAVSSSLAAHQWLSGLGCAQFYFKVCSTFDSTPAGNIGPVTDALMQATGEDFVVCTPAFPENHRSVYQGHLFVGSQPLHETGMRDHPLTPMTDANLVRVMQAQTRHRVGLIDYAVVAEGADRVRERIDQLRRQGYQIAIADALSREHLFSLGKAVADRRLVTAGSGLAIGLPQNHVVALSPRAQQFPKPEGSRAIVCGSCSEATRRQVQAFIDAGGQAWRLDPRRETDSGRLARAALDWAIPRLGDMPVLIYSTATPEEVRQAQATLGQSQAGTSIEQALGQVAQALVAQGVGQLVVAGGETSGACVQALGIDQLQIGPQIDPGVPWCFADRGASMPRGIHLALKSGNFGADDFFMKAFRQIASLA